MKSRVSTMLFSCLSLVCAIETSAMILERPTQSKTAQNQKDGNNKQSDFNVQSSRDQGDSAPAATEPAVMDAYDMLAKYALSPSAFAVCVLMALCALFSSDK